MKGDNLASARAHLAVATKARLKKLDAWYVIYHFAVPHKEAEKLVNEAKLARGIISLADLNPRQRRELVDLEKLNLHAIANGPIMDSNELYLPAGKISLDEAKAREQASILEARP